MGIDFTLTKEAAPSRPDVTVIHVSGWLDAQSEGRLVEAVEQAGAQGIRYVVLDLQELDTITSAGIRGIQRANQILAPTGPTGAAARIKLCNTPPRVYEILRMTGLLTIVPTYEGLDIALAACQS